MKTAKGVTIIFCPLTANRRRIVWSLQRCSYCLWLGGIKCSGRMLGNSFPSIFTLIKCIAKANSSMSKKPSQSTSDNFHIFDKTEFGSFDLMSSDFAAKMVNSKSNVKE